jgi:hypothetical protein
MGAACCDNAKPRRAGWLGVLPAIVACAFCPACLSVWTSLLPALGLGVTISERTHFVIVCASLVISLASLAWAFRIHRRSGPLIGAGLAATIMLANELSLEKLWIELPALGLLLIMSIWSTRLPRRHVHHAPALARAA